LENRSECGGQLGCGALGLLGAQTVEALLQIGVEQRWTVRGVMPRSWAIS
jgi:hypothetical protein